MELYHKSVDWQILQDLLACAAEVGVDLDRLGMQLGHNLNLQDIVKPSANSLEAYSLLDRRLADAVRKAIYNQAGFQAMSLRDYEILFHYMLGAENLLGALKRIPAFTRLVENRLKNARLELSQQGDVAVMTLDWGVGEAQAKYATLFFYELLRFMYIMEWMVGKSIDVRQLEVPFAHGSMAQEKLSVFQFPIRFSSSCYILKFSKKSLFLPIVRDLDELQGFLKVYPAVAMVGADFGKLSERIERILVSQGLAAQPLLTAPEVASAFNISEATMRRRLREEGASYGDIRRLSQRKVACHLLKRSHFDVGAISYQVGFADEAAFRRAFKSWTGKTPMEYRSDNHREGTQGTSD